jgi:hypothetical protein
VGEDQVVPAEVSDQPVARCQIDAHLPFNISDLQSHVWLGHAEMVAQDCWLVMAFARTLVPRFPSGSE